MVGCGNFGFLEEFLAATVFSSNLFMELAKKVLFFFFFGFICYVCVSHDFPPSPCSCDRKDIPRGQGDVRVVWWTGGSVLMVMLQFKSDPNVKHPDRFKKLLSYLVGGTESIDLLIRGCRMTGFCDIALPKIWDLKIWWRI